MFKSLYRMHSNPERVLPEAVLTGKGALVLLIIFLSEQLVASGISVLISLFQLPLGLMEINMIVNGGALLAMIFFFHDFFIQNIKSFFKEFKSIYLWLPIVSYICSFMANMVVQMILMLVRGELQNTSNNELVMELLYQYPLQLVLLTVIIAPITEEAVFRAALSRSMTASHKAWVRPIGFVLSIFLFSFFHVYQYVFFATDASGAVYLTFNMNEFLSILVYIPMAVGLTLCSYFGRNYWCSVICHMITNSVAVFMLLMVGQQAVK